MLSPILDPQQPITREDARMFERLARDKSWMGRVDADMREKIVNKLLVGYFRLSVAEGISQEELRNNLTILDRIAKTFGLLDRVDAEREKAMAVIAPPTTVNNTLNITLTRALESEDGRDIVARLRDMVADSDAAAPGKA